MTALIILAIWFVLACIAAPFVGRFLRYGRGPRGGGQK